MKFRKAWFSVLAAVVLMVASVSLVYGQANHVRWDIVNADFTTTPLTVTAGGIAFASADASLTIKLTGTGTFVSPASGGTSSAITGGGTWETFTSGVSTGSGTYVVTSLASWQFANFFPPGVNTDLIGNSHEQASGNAVLRIQYSDGSAGILGVGCHGPGAPAGIQEGVIATKGFVTYWTRMPPVPGVNANRTVFHVE
jgi:hypothetical protein